MTLPIWFLIVTLFLPRIGLFAMWHHGWHFDMAQPWSALTWAFVPRILVLMTIYSAQGFSGWFYFHLGFALAAAFHSRRRAAAASADYARKSSK